MIEFDDDRLWDPSAEGGPALEDLEARLSSLRASDPLPALKLPPRGVGPESPPADGPSRRGAVLVAAVLVAATLAALWLGRSAVRAPDIDAQGGPVAMRSWRVVALDSETQCSGVELSAGGSWPEAAPIDTGASGTARLERGEAELILHPGSRLRRRGDVLILERGRMWIDLPAEASGEAWTLELGGQTVRVAQGRLVLSLGEGDGEGEGGGGRIEVLRGAVELAGAAGSVRIEAGHTCRAVHDPGPLTGLGAFECAPTELGG